MLRSISSFCILFSNGEKPLNRLLMFHKQFKEHGFIFKFDSVIKFIQWTQVITIERVKIKALHYWIIAWIVNLSIPIKVILKVIEAIRTSELLLLWRYLIAFLFSNGFVIYRDFETSIENPNIWRYFKNTYFYIFLGKQNGFDQKCAKSVPAIAANKTLLTIFATIK